MSSKNSKQRRGTPKSRSGCLRCKQRHQKCDETEPACRRCQSVGAACSYGFNRAKKAETASYRNIVPRLVARSGRVQELPFSIYTGMTASEAAYLDRFKGPVSQTLIASGHSFELWYRTALRESCRDPCIRHCIVAIGALDCALESSVKGASANIPLYKLHASLPDSPHLGQATRSYASALADLNTRISQHRAITPAHDSSSPWAGANSLARTALIASVLFFSFENMQGNTKVADQLLTHTVRTFQTPLLRGLQSTEIPAIDDGGFQSGQVYLTRLAALRGLVSPAHEAKPLLDKETFTPPLPDATSSLEEIEQLWVRAVTVTALFLSKAHQIVVFGDLSPQSEERLQLEEEHAWIVDYCRTWDNFLNVKVAWANRDVNDNDSRRRQVFTLLRAGFRFVTIYATTMMDPTQLGWDTYADECEEILDLYIAWSDCRPAMLAAATIFERHPDDQFLLMLHAILARCRGRSLREKGLAVCQSRLIPSLELRNWETITVFMQLVATCGVEEKGRDPGTGLIPINSRFWWLGSDWNDDNTELVVKNRCIETETNVRLAMTLAEFERWVYAPTFSLDELPGRIIDDGRVPEYDIVVRDSGSLIPGS